MGALLVPVVILAVIVVVAVVGLLRWTRQRHAAAEALADPVEPTLDYAVPPGQDPVVLLTALSAEGYHATPDPVRTDVLHIWCPAGPDRDRAHVRATIAAVHTTAIDSGAPLEQTHVVFVDEA